MDKHASAIIKHEDFLLLDPSTLNKIFARDSFYVPEIEIFMAIQSWIKENPDKEDDEILRE